MNHKQYDYILVGSGLHNAVFAQQAKLHGKRCLVIDKRPHLGGNVYCKDEEGICIHLYGPHIFHTDNSEIWRYVNSFVPFNQFILNTIAIYNGKVYNLPFNMHTFYQMWGITTPKEAELKIREQIEACHIHVPHNLEEQALSLVGKDLYETLIKGYTEKQWGRTCCELPAFIIKRLPIRFTYNNNYFNDAYQGIPEGGYNKLIEKMLDGIECKTKCNYFDDKNYFDNISKAIVYSGAIDEYFGYQLGHLDYRSLRFEHESLHSYNYQGNAIVNYTDAKTPYTRIVEHKHFEIQNQNVMNNAYTVITKEFPMLFTSASNSEPYYPINDKKNNKLYNEYKQLAKANKNIIFGGRLAEYAYLDMHIVIERALAFWK